MPAFSVVIPTYNRAARVAAAVRSVLAQTERDLECLVVDDGSTDDTRARLESLREPRLRLFFNAVNRRQHACRNQAIRESRSPWIVFLDSDDIFLPRRLEALRAAAERAPQAGFWYCNGYLHRYGRLIGTLFDDGPLPEGRLPGHLAVGTVPYLTSTLAVRREAFDRTGFFREDLRILEDTELYARMLRDGLQAAALREPLMVRFLHESQITQDHERDFVEALEALKAGAPPAAEFERRRAELAREVAGYLLKAPRPAAARRLLAAELGPSARRVPSYWMSFAPAWTLRAAKALRRHWLRARHHPAWAGARRREVYRVIAELGAG